MAVTRGSNASSEAFVLPGDFAIHEMQLVLTQCCPKTKNMLKAYMLKAKVAVRSSCDVLHYYCLANMILNTDI